MKGLPIIVALLLVGCASSGPIPISRDTYLISKTSAGGLFVAASSIKAELLREAYAYCASIKKEFIVLSTKELGAIPAVRMPSAEVQFMCLNEGDPRLAAGGHLQRGPDQVIETRSR